MIYRFLKRVPRLSGLQSANVICSREDLSFSFGQVEGKEFSWVAYKISRYGLQLPWVCLFV